MIYFDENKEAYAQAQTLENWGKTLIFQCEDEIYEEFLQGERIWQGNELVQNPNYEAEQAQKERERIGNLTMTKRVFALILKEYGITYAQLKKLIATNEDAQLEWDLCCELQRKNPLLDIMAAKMNITPEQLDNMFKYANGEFQ